MRETCPFCGIRLREYRHTNWSLYDHVTGHMSPGRYFFDWLKDRPETALLATFEDKYAEEIGEMAVIFVHEQLNGLA